MPLSSQPPIVLPTPPRRPTGTPVRELDPALDSVVCAPPPGGFQLGWDEPPAPAGTPAPADEKPSVVQDLRYHRPGLVPMLRDPVVSVRVATTLTDVYREVRATYIADGSDGIAELLRLNPAQPAVGPGGFDPDLLSGVPEPDPDRGALLALVRRSRTRIEELGARAVTLVGAAAARDGGEALVAARAEIDRERPRYTTPETGPALRELHAAVLAVAPLLAVVAEIDRKRGKIISEVGRNEAMLAAMSGTALPPTPNLEPILAGDAAYQDLETRRRAAVVAVAGAVAARAPAMPVLWRLYDHPEAGDPVRLRELALELLETTATANTELSQRLRGAPGLVWSYPVLVRQTMTDRHVPQASVAWRAVEEKLAAENPTLRSSAKLSILTGLGTLAVPLAANPWVGGAIVAADIAAALWDSVEEWIAYRNDRDAHRAVLDPALSWSTAPSSGGAVFAIAMNLLTAIPGGGPAKAAKAVP